MKDQLEKVVEFSKKHGYECDVSASEGESFSLSAQGNKIDKYSVRGSKVLGVRVIKDGHVGISYSESLDDDSLKNMVKAAVENSQFTDTNEYETLSSAAKSRVVEKSISKGETTTQEKIDFCLRLESQVLKRDKRVQAVPYNGYSEGESSSYYLNSNGVFCSDHDFSMSCYTSALLNDGKDNSMNYYSSQARSFDELDAELCIERSIEHASNWLGAEPAETGSYDIIFTPDELQSVFGCFFGIFSAKGAWDKLNPMRDKLGELIAHKDLSITDTPIYKDAFYKYFYDSEGVPQLDLNLIKNGELTNFFHNTSTAAYFKTSNNARASRSIKGALGVGGTNTIIAKGHDSNITKGKYLELHSLQGLHSGASFVSGEFSFGASGYLCENGERIRPVKGITVAGNFYRMLKEIESIGTELQVNTSSSFFSPQIKFSQMKVAGK